MGHSFEARCPGFLKQVPYVLVQPSLILLHRQDIVGSLLQDALGNLLLAAHGVNGDDAALQVNSSSNRGMAVISLDFSSVFTCPRVRACPVLDTGVLAEAQALTR